MKRLFLAIFFLIAIVAGSLLLMHYISNEAKAMEKQLLKLETQIDQDNWDQASLSYQEFKKKWDSIDPKWSMIIDHYEIDYINMDLGELGAFIKAKDKTNASAKLSSLKILLKHIPEKEAPSLKNIL